MALGKWIGCLGLGANIAVLAALETSLGSAPLIPAPFLMLYASVVLAAFLGGLAGGLASGALSAAFVWQAHLVGFGPATLTGTPVQALLGMLLYFGTGAALGQLRSQHSRTLHSLLQTSERLRDALTTEMRLKKATEVDAARTDSRLQAAVRIGRIGHFEFDTLAGKCLFCSENHAAHFGMTPEEFMTKAFWPDPSLAYVHPLDRDKVREAITRLKAGEPQQIEFRAMRPDGEIRHIREMVQPEFDETGRVIRELGCSMDLTDLRQAEERLRESQRLEAVGQLTAGVAHDFNNLLSVILGNLELLKHAKTEAEAAEMIRSAISATSRGGALTSQLLSFGRRAMLNPERVEIGETLAHMANLFGRTLSASIAIELETAQDTPPVSVDRGQFEAAMLNLVINAADAMPDGGLLRIATTAAHMSAAEIERLGLQLEPGSYAAVSVGDDGAGIPEEIRSRVFEPFYTTKEVGKGSGLGLPMALGFTRQSGGDVRLESGPGKGTRITLFFPACDMPATEAGDAVPARPAVVGSGGKKVLLVEDNEAVRKVIANQLKSLGYEVATAETGDMAREILDRGEPVALVLSDVVMPGGVQGTDLARHIRKNHPSIPVALMSGYHDIDAARALDGARDVPLYTKPMTRDTLRQVMLALEGESAPVSPSAAPLRQASAG